MRIRGQRALITGASSGLGAALARELAERGAACALAARRRGRLESLAAEIRRDRPGTTVVTVTCDVTDPDCVTAAVGAVARELGGIDLLVNDAGICAYGDTERTSDRDLTDLLAVNLLGSVRTMRAVVPLMRQRGGGRIVNIASLAALHGVPYLAAYGASKAALAVYSQSLRAELARDGIGVQVVYPGYTAPEIFAAEKTLSGVRRPDPPYAPADRVARRIVDAIERGAPEVVLDARGRWLSLLRGLVPGAIDRIMARLAVRLGRPEEVDHA